MNENTLVTPGSQSKKTNLANQTPKSAPRKNKLSKAQTPAKAQKSSFKDELKSFFWIILIVLCIRAFIVEPYKIPTASMVPSLLVGDHIFVTKFAYSVGIPFTKIKLFDTGKVKRGDVAVFLYPEDDSINFVKRVIALPGDTVEIKNRTIFVNDQAVNMEKIPPELVMDQVVSQNKNPYQQLYLESYPKGKSGFEATNTNFDPHYILLDDMNRNPLTQFFEKTKVPEGHYFVMGDNRDRSSDSRSWGFVPHNHLKGRASIIWWSIHAEQSWSNLADKFRWRRFFTWVN